METRAQYTKIRGSCNIDSSKTEHMARLRSEEEYGSLEAELFLKGLLSLPVLSILRSAAVTTCDGKSADESVQRYLQFWPRLRPRAWSPSHRKWFKN